MIFVYFFVWIKLLTAQQIETFFSAHKESGIPIQIMMCTLLTTDPHASIAISSCFPDHCLSLFLCPPPSTPVVQFFLL